MSQSRPFRRSDLAPCRLLMTLLPTTWLVVVNLAFPVWPGWLGSLTLITDWSWQIESSWSLYRASRNRYYPFAHGPPGPKSTDPVWSLCPIPTTATWNPMCCRCPADPPVARGTQARRPAAEMWNFSWSKVQCVPLFPFAHGTLTLPSKSPFSLYNLSFYKISFSNLSFSNFSFSKLSSSNFSLSKLSSPLLRVNSPRTW